MKIQGRWGTERTSRSWVWALVPQGEDKTNGMPVLKMSELLETDADLNFLLSLKPEAIERRVTRVKTRVDQIGEVK